MFVRGAVPGDRVRARIGKSKRSWAEAELVELLEPSPERVEPEAPHPGAPWQVLPYERQLEEKEAQVRDALERIGGFEAPPVEPIVPALERLVDDLGNVGSTDRLTHLASVLANRFHAIDADSMNAVDEALSIIDATGGTVAIETLTPPRPLLGP